MGTIMRASLATITVVGIAGVALRLSGHWERIGAARQWWGSEDFQRRILDGPVGPFLVRCYAPFNSLLYAAYAKGIGLQPDDEVLDVACGSGVFLAKHARRVRRIAGLDMSRSMIDQAVVENAQRVADGTGEFVVGDAAALPWPDDTFTVVTSNDLSCYEPKAPAAIREMYRVLKPGGRVVIGMDRREAMEAAGFQRVSGRHVMGAYLTTGYKDQVVRRQRLEGRTERIRVIELEGPEQYAIVSAYAAWITCGCRHYMAKLPNPVDHPAFRIEPLEVVDAHAA